MNRVRWTAAATVGVAFSVAFLLGGCASTPYAKTAISSVSAHPAKVKTADAVPFVVITPSSTLVYTDSNETYIPLSQTTSGLVSADTAFLAVREGLDNVSASDGTAVPTAALYSYSNNTYGQIQADGSIKLTYQKVPVWLFSVPLKAYLPGPGSKYSPHLKPATAAQNPSDCTYVMAVTATDGTALNGGEQCVNQ